MSVDRGPRLVIAASRNVMASVPGLIRMSSGCLGGTIVVGRATGDVERGWNESGARAGNAAVMVHLHFKVSFRSP
jgi:hypothetical protein